ncbi:MAG: type II toxin-antitoxin system HicB family antitoxin [Actinomycetes bacterium]
MSDKRNMRYPDGREVETQSVSNRSTTAVSHPTDPGPDVRAIGPYREAALRRAVLERLEDGIWYAEIEELPGVWADGPDPASCIESLREVIEEWVVLKLRDGDVDFPVLDGADLNRR